MRTHRSGQTEPQLQRDKSTSTFMEFPWQTAERWHFCRLPTACNALDSFLFGGLVEKEAAVDLRSQYA